MDLPGKIPTGKNGKPTTAYLRAAMEVGFCWAQLERASASEVVSPENVERHRQAFNLYTEATRRLRSLLRLPEAVPEPEKRIIQ